MAAQQGAIVINFDEESVVERLNELTRGKGPEKCIDAVGMEAHANSTWDAMYDRAKQALMLKTDRAHVLREMIYVCRPAGIPSARSIRPSSSPTRRRWRRAPLSTTRSATSRTAASRWR